MKNKQTKQIFYYMLLLGVIIAPCFMYVPPIYGCTVDSITLYTGSSSTSLTASALRIPQGSNAYYYARCTVTNPNQYRILWEFDIDGNGVYEYLTITYYDSSGYYLKAPSSTASRYFSNSGTFNARVRCCLIDASGSAVSSYVSDTCDIYVVGVGSVSAGGETSTPGNIKTIYVAKGSPEATIPVTAAPNPSGAWPSGKPTWNVSNPTAVPIDTAGTTTVTATCGTSSLSINIVVVEVDLDMEGVDDAIEETVGGFIALNDDDDDFDGVMDIDDGYNKDGIPGNDDDVNMSENDLVKITLNKVLPESLTGSLTLSAGNGIKIWQSAIKGGTALTLPVQFNTPADLPKELWIEGVMASTGIRDSFVKLEYEIGDRTFMDNIKITVIDVDITTPAGSLDWGRNPQSSWQNTAPYHFDFQGIIAGEPGAYALQIRGEIAPSTLTYKWTLDASCGTLSDDSIDDPDHIPPASEGQGTLKLEAYYNGNPTGIYEERVIKIYPDHLARDCANFGTGGYCVEVAGVPWKVSTFNVHPQPTMNNWNCHGSTRHAYDGSYD
ncbi:MAG: hypothetical protein GX874_10685, partial [Smithella sp.]|nr:hypothetical protein [Smithella sp.]